MEGQCLRPTTSRAMKPAANRATTEPNQAVAALSHAGSCGRQRGARSRRAEPDGDPTEKPRARAPRAHPRRASVRPKDLQISALSVAGDAELLTAPEPQQTAVLDPQALADPEVPVISKRPGHRRGARSTGKQRTPRGSRKEQEETPDKKLKKVLENLRLKRNEISVAAEVVNGVVGHLLSRMRSHESEFNGVQQLNAGSYYEHVKISAPNEFDVMFKLEVPRIQLQEYYDTGAFYFVKLGRIPRGNPLGHFLVGGILSASKMLSKFREIIKEEVKNIKGVDVSVEKEKPGSPAVTLLIRNPEEISVDIILALESKGSWPVSTKEGLPIQNWLGTKVRTNLRREPFYLVPKNAKVGNGFQGKTWRLSFSHTEKYILNNHGVEKTCCESAGVKCCRKDCLKLMKYLLEQLKKEYEELDDFCSYHVKTAIFHMWTENPQDSKWDPKHVSACFDNFLTFFVECLKTEKLMHYFIPKFNLFSQELIDKNSKEFLLKRIEYERNNGFPIFDKF